MTGLAERWIGTLVPMLTLVIVYDAWTKVGLCLGVTGLSYLSCDAMCVAWDVRLSGRQCGYSTRKFSSDPIERRIL